MNLLGQKTKQYNIIGNNLQINLIDQEAGVYLLVFTNGNEKIVKKIILSK